MRKLNNKGYMLVEIILAFAITFALIYFIMDLVINIKNKNDDLLVETLVKTDQTIITNKLMDYAIDEGETFNCTNLKNGITDKSVSYGGKVINVVNEYATIDKNNVDCTNQLGKVNIKIPLNVKQISDENFNIIIDYKYEIGDMISPSCKLTTSGNQITAESTDGESGLVYYGWDSSYSGKNSIITTFDENAEGTYTYYVVDGAGNTTTCSVVVEYTVVGQDCVGICPSGYGYHGSWNCYRNTCSPGYCPDWTAAIGEECTDKMGYVVTINNSE